MYIGNGNSESSVEGNKVNQKIPLSEAPNCTLDAIVRVFKVKDNEVSDLSRVRHKIHIAPDAIGGYVHDYQKDEMIPTKFEMFVHSGTATGVNFEITEEMLEKMLDYIREEKKKVYCFEGCS